MWIEDAIPDGQTGSSPKPRRRADEVTEAVDGTDGRVLEGACEEGTGKVRCVMFHVMHARGDMRFVEAHAGGARARKAPDRRHGRESATGSGDDAARTIPFATGAPADRARRQTHRRLLLRHQPSRDTTEW